MKNESQEWESNWYVDASEALARKFVNGEAHAVTYDNARSIANKVRYAIKMGLQGVMVWTVDTDDFRGDCDITLTEDRFSDFRTAPNVKLTIPKYTGKNYPLLRTLNEAISLTLSEIRQETKETDKDNEIDHKEHNTSPSKPSNGISLVPNFLVIFIISVSFRFV
jgi:chitinase